MPKSFLTALTILNVCRARALISLAILVFACPILGVGPLEAPNTSADPPPVAIYDADANHLWNRLFAAFYVQKIANNFADRNTVAYNPSTRGAGEPHWLGPDVLDPPFGYHPKFLLADEPFARCNALLDEFLDHDGVALIRDPLKRALMQHDLWGVFDVLAQSAQMALFPFPTDNEGFRHPPLTAEQEKHRAILEQKLARAIHELALSRDEIEKLPDTYNAAVKSGGLSKIYDKTNYDFLPPDLFDPKGGWHEVSSGRTDVWAQPNFHAQPGILEHTRVAGGRSVFRTFVKLPEGYTNSSILDEYTADIRRMTEQSDRNHTDWEHFWATNSVSRSNVLTLQQQQGEAWKQFGLTNNESVERLSPQPVRGSVRLPHGMQFALLREMICLNTDGAMQPTRIVESIQYRTMREIDYSAVERVTGREVELNRALLFASKQGGLRSIAHGEPRSSFYNSLGHLRVDEDGNGPTDEPFPQNCSQCHFDNRMYTTASAFSASSRLVSIEPVVQWKEKNGKLDLLRELIKSSPPGGQ